MISPFILACIHFYRPKRSFGQGNVFTRVCDSVHRGGAWSGTPPPGRHPPRQAPPKAGTHPPGSPPPGRHPPRQAPPPGRHPPSRQAPPLAGTPLQAGTPPGRHPPSRQAPLQAGTPPGRHPLRQAPPKAGTPSPGRHPPRQAPPLQAGTPPGYGQRSAGTHPTGMHSCYSLCLCVPTHALRTCLHLICPFTPACVLNTDLCPFCLNLYFISIS